MLMLDKLTEPAARLWYLRATARFGWSRNVLLNESRYFILPPFKMGQFELDRTDYGSH